MRALDFVGPPFQADPVKQVNKLSQAGKPDLHRAPQHVFVVTAFMRSRGQQDPMNRVTTNNVHYFSDYR